MLRQIAKKNFEDEFSLTQQIYSNLTQLTYNCAVLLIINAALKIVNFITETKFLKVTRQRTFYSVSHFEPFHLFWSLYLMMSFVSHPDLILSVQLSGHFAIDLMT